MDNNDTDNNRATKSPDRVAIEGELPLKPVGIENLKEANPKHMPPHRYIHHWFARRPTPAARLAILGSIMPEGTTPDELLSLMQIGPEGLTSGISEYVQKKKETENERDGTLGEWYGYPRPFTQTPTNDEIESLHKTLTQTWGGDLPTVLDATAGGGVIPFESIRYELPTIANELNPVPSLILKVLLEYAPSTGSLEQELYSWRDRILSEAADKLEPYYPTERDGRQILASACTYLIQCDSCGGDVPTVPKWWVQKKSSSEGVAVKPEYKDGTVTYECVQISKNQATGFNPSKGTVTRGDVECPHCGVVTENEAVKEKLRQDEFEYDVYAVKYTKPSGGSGYRAGKKMDRKAIKKAKEYIESDFELLTFLTTSIPSGFTTDQPRAHGITEWRDMFNPRQLVSHYEYLQVFNSVSEEIYEKHTKAEAEAILTILTLSSSKFMTYNSRLSSWHTGRGYPDHIFKSSNLGFCRIFTDNNPATKGMGYKSHARKVIDSYEKIVEMVEGKGVTAKVRCGDAATLTDDFDTESIQAAVVDPPYYDTIPYAEFSDVFYVLQKEYLRDVHPELFSTELTNKTDEAIANPSKFDKMSGSKSKTELAKEDYERKMRDIFSELFSVLDKGGVLTIMFTHKKADAWDTLATSLIEAGFTIIATHPITSEIPTRASVQNKNSADSTILLTGRKPHAREESSEKTLWEEVKQETIDAATKAANNLHDSGLSLTKTDTIISTFGPTLQVYAENYPVVNKKGENIPPRKALTEARNAAVEVLVERHMTTERFDGLDELSQWYILAWLVYEDSTFPYDEGRQLGLGVGIDIDNIKRETKIWGKRGGDIELKSPSSRIQDIVRLEAGDNVSSRKYPVNPTQDRFSHAIDAVQSAIHVYEQKGAEASWEWLTSRNLKNNKQFETTIMALLEVLPPNQSMRETLLDIVSGKTGDYLDIDIGNLNLNIDSADDKDGLKQSGLSHFE